MFDKESGELLVVEVVTGGTFIPGERRALFSVEPYSSNPQDQYYDGVPDDQRFLMIRREEEPGRIELIVEDFFEELKARVGN